MNTFDHTSRHANRIAPRLRWLLRSAVAGTALAALPGFAHAAAGGEEHMYDVVAAFGLLVVAATVASIVTVWSQRGTTDTLTQPDYPKPVRARLTSNPHATASKPLPHRSEWLIGGQSRNVFLVRDVRRTPRR